MAEFKDVLEGRFGEPGTKPAGLLGAVSRHWDTVCGKQRKLGVTEQWLARAISRAFMEVAGGVEEDGLMVVRPGKGPADLERLAAVEQDVGSLKMLLANLRGVIQAQLAGIGEASDKVKALEEKISTLEMRREDDAKRSEILFEELSKLRKNLVPAPVSGASGPHTAQTRRGRSATAGTTDAASLPEATTDTAVPPAATQSDDKW